MGQYIYVVFSATPYKMGKFIRKITKQQYNHVSIAFDDTLKEMYSFARHYQDTPLYGGFVEESHARYFYKEEASKVKVHAIPLDLKEYEDVSLYIQSFKENQKEYLYNTISAIFTPLRYRVQIHKSYTCTEFATSVLAQLNTGIEEKEFYSIEELEKELEHCIIFQGSIEALIKKEKEVDSEFLEEHNIMWKYYNTGILFGKLIVRLCGDRFNCCK